VSSERALVRAAGDDFCYLTTRGRISGHDHEIEIWFAVRGTTLYMLAGGGARSDWVRNLHDDPSARLRVGDVTYPGTGRILTAGTDEDALARELVFDKYQPRYSGGLDGWRVRSLAVAIDLDGADEAQS
jgi:hypothetical protein